MNSRKGTPLTHFKNNTIGLDFRLQEKRFCKLQETICLTVIKEIFNFPPFKDTMTAYFCYCLRCYRLRF